MWRLELFNGARKYAEASFSTLAVAWRTMQMCVPVAPFDFRVIISRGATR